MKTIENPFFTRGYHGSDFFCDREDETKRLIDNSKNGINTTLLSVRRMGKTGLIHHFFNKLRRNKKWECIYIDIYATQNLNEFTNSLTTAIINAFPKNRPIGKKFIELIKGFSPVISYDSFTGLPQITLSYSQQHQYEYTLIGIFDFLENQKKKVVIAIDEFQQIRNYPEINTEALLRTIIQPLKNVIFIFSGSNKHLLMQIFNSAKQPFFSSTQFLSLENINKEDYSIFIKRLFKKNNRDIDEESVDFILNWSKIHTYYTQALCNKIYSQNLTKIRINDVYYACDSLLEEQENIYFQYRNLLTKSQWKLLKAIGKSGEVYQPTGTKFITKYQLGNPASVRRSLKSLEEKEMVLRVITADNNFYQVYDCFLSKWLERL